MPPAIRIADTNDLTGLEEIENDADVILVDRLNPEVWTPAPSAAERMGRRGYVLVLAEDDGGDAIGFAHVLLIPGWAHLEQVSVLPAHARHGHGRALVESAKREARALGCEIMTLRTFADIPWNAPFYASCGFVEAEPSTPFERELIHAEEEAGILDLGRRIEMICHIG
ncbi:MAG TPA: GNAT family N-acetyltransferase [Galbitalea sp.]|jgi:GNAT superfamily N-acetyltransferase